MLFVIKPSKLYKELIQLTTCDQNNADCTLQRWENNPGESPFRGYLSQIFLDEADESSRISLKE